MNIARPYPVTRFHWTAALPGFVVVLALATELCALAVWFARVLR